MSPVPVRIPVRGGRWAVVDEADAGLVKGRPWHLSGGYAQTHCWIGDKLSCELMHRLIMAPPKGMVVDHINGDRLDNRRENLRVCSNAQNISNRVTIDRRNKSGVTGVHWHAKAGKWAAEIKRRHLGLFATIEEAAKVRRAAELAIFGEFAPRERV